MMNALPQPMPAQGGLMAVLTGLGARPAGGASPAGFEALFADMPLAEGVSPLPAEALRQLQRAIGDQAGAEPVEGDAIPADAATPQTPPAATGDDAAAAAALLIHIATGAPPAQAAAPKPAAAPVVAGEGEADSEDGGEPPATGEDMPPANPLLALAAPVAADPAKPVQANDAKPEDAPALPRPAKPETAAPQFADTAPAAAPKTGRTIDTGAAMTVLFAPPAPQAHAANAPAAATPVTAPVAERVLDMASDDAWIAQLAADIAATKSQEGDISFRLMPRHLGRLDVAMTSGDGGVSLKLDTQHEATATLVHAAQGKLVDDLRQQGVRVTGAEVTCTPGETGRQSQGQGQGRAATPDTAHLIETAATARAGARADTSNPARAADRRGRFA